MKKKLKLLLTAAALGISAVSVATGTYAWWTLNTETDSEGLQIEAVTPQELFIRETPAANVTPLMSDWAGKVTFDWQGGSQDLDGDNKSDGLPAVAYSKVLKDNQVDIDPQDASKGKKDEPIMKFYKAKSENGIVSPNGTIKGKKTIDDIIAAEIAATNSIHADGTTVKDVVTANSFVSNYLEKAVGGTTCTTLTPTDYFHGSVDLIMSTDVAKTAKITPTAKVTINKTKIEAAYANVANFDLDEAVKKAYGALHVGYLTTETKVTKVENQPNKVEVTKSFVELDFSNFVVDANDDTLYTLNTSAPIIKELGRIDDTDKSDEGSYIDDAVPATVEIFVWYDGSDDQCTNAAISNAGLATVVVTFASEYNI